MGTIKEAILICVAIVLPVGSWATLPLITDDTGTQGRGKFQLEAAGDYDRDKEIFGGVTVKQTDCFITPTLTYGITDTVDLFGGLPYQWSSVETEGNPATGRVNGKAILVPA